MKNPMFHKPLSRSLLYLSICLLLALWSISSIQAQTSEPTTAPTEEVVVTEEAVSTEVAPPVVEVNINNEETPAAPTTDNDYDNIYQIVKVAGAFLVFIAFMFKGGDLFSGLGSLVNSLLGNQWLKSAAMTQYQTLSPDLKEKVGVFIAIADPLSKTSIDTVDDRIVAWLEEITTPVEDKNKSTGVG